jgi:hypothetical protein
MRTIHLIIALAICTGTLTAQNVGIGNPNPAEKLDVNGRTKTVNLQMTTGASNGYFLQSDASGNASWVPSPFGSTHGGGLIPFSTGVVLNGPAVVSAAPVLMGFGNHTVETINFAGESTNPAEAGGFSFTVPFTGTISNLQISTDLFVVSIAFINIQPLTYQFTVFVSPSIPNNGISHIASSYVTMPLNSTLTFGGPGNTLFPGTYYSATNLNTGSLAVNAGDRIGVRIRPDVFSDISTNDVSQLSFSASLFYSY